MIKSKLKKSILFTLLAISIISVGCSTAEKPNKNLSNSIVDLEQINRYIEEDVERRKNDINYQQVVKAELIADNLVSEKKIYDATVLLYSQKALVGIEIVEDINGNIPNEISEKVKNIIKEIDSEIKTVIITSDDEIFNKIDELERSLIKGDERRNISKDIELIIQEINDN